MKNVIVFIKKFGKELVMRSIYTYFICIAVNRLTDMKDLFVANYATNQVNSDAAQYILYKIMSGDIWNIVPLLGYGFIFMMWFAIIMNIINPETKEKN